MGPQGPLLGGIAPRIRHMGPLGPLMGRNCSRKPPHGPELLPKGATWAPLGPLWAGITPKRRHMGPLGPYGADLAPSPPGQLLRSSQGRFFFPRKPLFGICGPKMGQKKVEIEGWDLSSEIRSGILCRLVLVVCKTVGWRPISSQIGVVLGPLGFRPQAGTP